MQTLQEKVVCVNLDRQLASVMRNLARTYAEKGKLKPTLSYRRC